MKLRTSCNKCIFKTLNECDLGKPSYIEETSTRQFVDGYCSSKRTEKWPIELHYQDTVDQLNSEESKLSVVILYNNKYQDLIDTIENIKNSFFVKQIVVSTYLTNSNEVKTLVSDISNRLKDINVCWSIDHFKAEFDNHQQVRIDNCARLIKYNWFLTLNSGDILSNDLKASIINAIDNTNNNVLYYFEENDHIRFLTNRFAYNELQGNYGQDYFDKIKTFENWKDVCQKLENNL